MKSELKWSIICAFVTLPCKRLILFILVLIVSIIIGHGLFFKEVEANNDQSKKIRVLSVITKPVEVQESYSRIRHFLGYVEAGRTSRLGFEIGGTLQNLFVQEGETVSKGTLLASLDTSRLIASKNEVTAQLKEIEATLKLARATFSRTRQAKKLLAVSTQKLDEAEYDLLRQQASLERIQASINKIDVDIEKSSIYAPYSGKISYRMKDEGAVVTSGQPVLEIMETDVVEIRIGIDRTLSQKLQPGDVLNGITSGSHFAMEIDRILPGREQSTRLVEIIASPQGDKTSLREGDVVDIQLTDRIQRQGVWLPVSSLKENVRGLWSCMVAIPLSKEDKATTATHILQRRDIEVITFEQDRIYVSGDLLSGTEVVLDGLHRVVPGQRVHIASVEESPKNELNWLE